MSTTLKTAAIIVAAGTGLRMGGPIAKQWRMLAGKRVADRTLDSFRNAPGIDRIVMVLHKDEMQRAADYPDITCVAGGASRDASVLAGLEALVNHRPDCVLIHDVARPLVSQQIIADVCDALKASEGAAPALEITDALWLGADAEVTGVQDRHGLYRAQTPQGFRFDAILAAHRAHPGGALDDVEVARSAGMAVAMVPGEERNLKLTRAEDFPRAEAFLRTDMDIRTGNGFDVHRFGPGNCVTLCGVDIPHSHGLVGHSDADVAMHTVTDALYGALAEGDIGRHFPPSDDQWKGAASAIFLKHAVDLAAAKGFAISNIDVTIICELPKITPHAPAMIAEMAKVTGLAPDRISVKATTSEKLGFTGRGEGIAAMATATVIKS